MPNKPKTGLGRGIDSLISSDFNRDILEHSERVQNVFIKDIKPLPGQPRKHFDQTALDELAESIKIHGILQPLIVSGDQGNYMIIAGERRWRAAQIAKLEKVPVIVRQPKQQEKLEIALIENVQRVDLSPLEQAATIEKLHQDFNLAYNEIAKKLGKASTTVNNIVRLLQLPDLALKALQEGKITEGHARAILALKTDVTKQMELLGQILQNGWSVRQAEQFSVSSKQGAKTKQAVAEKMATETPKTKQLGTKLHTKVSIKRTARGGRIEIHFKDDKQLDSLLELIG